MMYRSRQTTRIFSKRSNKIKTNRDGIWLKRFKNKECYTWGAKKHIAKFCKDKAQKRLWGDKGTEPIKQYAIQKNGSANKKGIYNI
jgi:hypothetical protein